MSLFDELKRRNVFRVAIAYLVAAWLLIQLTDILVPMLTLPEWVSRFILLLLVILFIPTLIAAWALEMTPEGLKLEKNVDRSESITPKTGKKLNGMIIGVLALAVVLRAAPSLTARAPRPVLAQLSGCPCRSPCRQKSMCERKSAGQVCAPVH